jgi:hypothetical protein
MLVDGQPQNPFALGVKLNGAAAPTTTLVQ